MSKSKIISNIREIKELSKNANQAIKEIKSIAMDELYHLDKTTRQMIKNLKLEFNSTKVLVTKQRINHDKILNAVKSHFGVDFTRKTRKFQYKEARQVACYFFRKYSGLSLGDIAEYVGLGDHTTVLYSIKKVEDLMHVDSAYRDMIQSLESKLLEEVKAKNDNNI